MKPLAYHYPNGQIPAALPLLSIAAGAVVRATRWSPIAGHEPISNLDLPPVFVSRADVSRGMSPSLGTAVAVLASAVAIVPWVMSQVMSNVPVRSLGVAA